MKFSVGGNRQFNLIKMEYCQAKFLFPLRQKHVSAIRQANFQYDVAQNIVILNFDVAGVGTMV